VSRDDNGLIRRVGQGDLGAMQVLYERYAPRLYRFALARLGDERGAEDVVQETMLAAWQGASRFRGDSTAATWLFGICRRKMAEAHRKGRRRETPGLPPAADGTAPADTGRPGRGEDRPPAGTPAGPAPPDAGLEFWETFSRLSDEHQEVLLLVFHYGLSQEEAAQVLGVPVGTVKSRVHYARRRLREALGDAG